MDDVSVALDAAMKLIEEAEIRWKADSDRVKELEGWIEETNKILLLPIPGDTNQSAASVIAHAKMALKGERSGLSDLATGATGKIRLRGEGA